MNSNMNPLGADIVVAVIGSGAMGAGIAQVAAQAGHTVKLFDARHETAVQALTNIRAQLNKLVEKGRMKAEDAQACQARLHAVGSLSELSDAGLIIEAIVENLDIKRTVFTRLEDIVTPECIFASNTSSISITLLAAGLRNPARMVGMHFFNPAPVMKLVEVVRGLASDEVVCATVFATAQAWGKTAVYAASTPGFIVNRVARPYYSEALRCLQEHCAPVATIDTVLRDAGGFRMGAFELMDLVGLDVNFAVTNTVWNAYFNDPRYTPSVLQQEMVSAGWLGKKTQRGFYDYRDGATIPTAVSDLPIYQSPQNVTFMGTSTFEKSLAKRCVQHGIEVAQTDETVDECIIRIGDAWVLITDGRTATRRAHELGQKNVVVMDLLADYAQGACIDVARSMTCTQNAFESAVGWLQALGLIVHEVNDTPALILMRTVAMLINEAADAVYQGVGTPEAIDTAMCLGLNYPRGPFAWAEYVGLARVREVLHNIREHYGEARYKVSPWIEQQFFAS